MGASSYDSIWKTRSERKLKKMFDEKRREDQAYYGSDPYSGSLATLGGIRIVSDPKPDRRWTQKKYKEVVEYLLESECEKWEDALAVKHPKGYVVVAWLAT